MNDATADISEMYELTETLEQPRLIAFAQLDSGRGIVVTEGDDDDLQLWLANVGKPPHTLAQVDNEVCLAFTETDDGAFGIGRGRIELVGTEEEVQCRVLELMQGSAPSPRLLRYRR